MRRAFKALITSAAAATLVASTAPVATADPAPGFEFDPVALETRMTDCLEYAVDNTFVLMGWVNVRTGETRQWRCSSLKHMMWDERPGEAHDPFVDVNGFMRCADRVVSYGFPRDAQDPKYTRYILQYQGTARRGNVVVNPVNGDIASIYTEPNNDWGGCAFWQPYAAQGAEAPAHSPWQMTYPDQHAASGSTTSNPAAA